MRDIEEFCTFRKMEPLDKGWSGDQKYYLEAEDGRRLLLCVADISEFKRKKAD